MGKCMTWIVTLFRKVLNAKIYVWMFIIITAVSVLFTECTNRANTPAIDNSTVVELQQTQDKLSDIIEINDGLIDANKRFVETVEEFGAENIELRGTIAELRELISGYEEALRNTGDGTLESELIIDTIQRVFGEIDRANDTQG